MKKGFSAKRITTLSMLTAVALIMFMIESLFPPLFIPGAKMGLSNIMTLFALVLLSPIDALILVVVRTVVGSLFVGSLSTLTYSLTAGLVALCFSIALYKWAFPKISLVAISAFSAVIHNGVQNLVFCLVTNTFALLVYLPYLTLIGLVAGVIVGIVVTMLFKKLPDNLILKMQG